MNERDLKAPARLAVAKILEVLNIARVVCVDDTYQDRPSVDDLIVTASSLDAPTLERLFPELEGAVPGDDEVLRARIRTSLGRLDEDALSAQGRAILESVAVREGDVRDDLVNLSVLGEVIPDGVLIPLSLRKWQTERERLLVEGEHARTLYLFDQNLSYQGGEVDGGIKIISSLLAGDTSGQAICGLLTHTVTGDDYLERWQELSEEHKIPVDRFLVIPKLTLSDDPVAFAQALKFVALLPDFSALKKKASELIRGAMLVADTRISEINIYDLDHIVLESSSQEGVWEPDTLFRLHGLFQRLESRRLAFEGGEIEQIASRLRVLSTIRTETRRKPASRAWAIQKEELYEGSEHLNRYHFPLDLGDVFVKTEGESRKHYILLAQPCDLMVRSRGRRAPELVHVPLVEIGPAKSNSEYAKEMPYFGSGPGDDWSVRLKNVQQIRVVVLDLCILNIDGRSMIRLGEKAPDGLLPAWQERYQILQSSAEKMAGRLDLTAAIPGEAATLTEFKGHLRPEMEEALLNEVPFRGSLMEEQGHRDLIYNCRRVCRLTRARAFDLLMEYTGCLSRTAQEHDFG